VSAPAATNLERVLYPATGFTKGDLIEYYRAVAPRLLPELAGRAVTLGRWPGGVDRPGFATTEAPGRPEWVRTAPVVLSDGAVRRYCLIEDERSLLWAANLGTIELHRFPAFARSPDTPAELVLDLDPLPGAGLAECVAAAPRLRDRLLRHGLEPRVKTTGGRGLHVWAPLEPGWTFHDTSALARELAQGEREAVVDWRQNHPRRSLLAPWSLRAADRPGVSVPLDWPELEGGMERLVECASARAGTSLAPWTRS
jgi:bifunctional non-homologous end joining protein LigD